ncbi:MbtH family NRPS accessory protein [Agrobacterium vitis]|uniref:MbtH family protein n=1 Tax=Rhizobium/Agrobacterium group TaxID=227290 RepID=UPI0012E96600|nr:MULTISPECIES: MbtH family NRPS accessory protein [Rhizobium/Agrobacterium group]MCF1496233.1 MbtH family NRPS accessory protein [Allorhizobium ampelinum]MVA48944.1 MbtH family NRPS accessory protein [Agrobacterium vitis]
MTGAKDLEYHVVTSDEERYSIWPTYKETPIGWRTTGFSGPKQACLDHIAEVWTDMRPASLRRSMEAEQAGDDAHRGDAS